MCEGLFFVDGAFQVGWMVGRNNQPRWATPDCFTVDEVDWKLDGVSGWTYVTTNQKWKVPSANTNVREPECSTWNRYCLGLLVKG